MTCLSDLQLVLDKIEEEEAKLLTWGDTGAQFSEDEVFQIIEKLLPTEDPDDVFDDLLSHAILLPVVNAAGINLGYRSRMGESVHLYRNLRQWFHGKSIEQSSTLVSDFRFLRRPRLYPKRDLVLSELFDKWSSSTPLAKTIRTSLTALVGEYKLSGFQSRATERILTAIPKHTKHARNSTATIVCAGTGSGKTMAFYLPALSSLVSDVLNSSESRVRVLAIYPRKELLKDQFNEAWEQCRKLDDLVYTATGRKLRIGAMFGDTPDRSNYALKPNQKYRTFGLLRCTTLGCDGEMRWQKEDIDKGTEILRCYQCGHSVTGGEVALTRQSMVKNPPDILFTTTEMLNQKMGHPYHKKLFGIGTKHPIPIVLLDEVHTYDGNQGAQTAFLLRRWMKLSKCSPHFVGLSATLTDAENYFSRLTGTNASRVRLIEPLHDELIAEGAEYLLALRGDPVSQTALLSTTIQTTMLSRRLQDTRRDKKSGGTWGSKTFVFTDQLDVINRLYFQLTDAEGWRQKNGQLIPNGTAGPLAQLRNPITSQTSREQLIQYGQDWSATKNIGYELDENDQAIISRTSSQDTGVDNQAEVVVATASLEVGFNDPEVGTVIQHKAPQGIASYLQRKGRAGRLRNMRPWMVIILSEFGRDRTTYQHYERLLDPEVKLQSLPIDNSHIQRMQAAMATLDWLSTQITGFNPWLNFNQPKRLGSNKEKLNILVNEVIEGGRLQDNLIDYLSKALRIDKTELDKLLWQAPRSIFMGFLPTIRRRLETNWGRWSNDAQMLQEWAEINESWGSPVPEFIPDNLFSDLNLPALHISLSRGENVSLESMQFFQGLREFSPGRISKRFSVHSGQFSDWLVPVGFTPNSALHNTSIDFEVDQGFGEVRTFIDEIPETVKQEKIAIYQPHQVFTTSISRQFGLSETSNAMLRWQSFFRPVETSEVHPLPKGSLWSKNFQSISFYSHRSLTQLEVIRYNTGSDAELRFRDGQKARIKFNWQHKGQKVGIGARLWVDAAKIQFQITKENLIDWLRDDALMRVLRSSYLQDQLQLQEVFEGNKFKSNWVYECFIAAITLDMDSSGCEISTALNNVCKSKSLFSINKIPEILFQQDIGQFDDDKVGDASDQNGKDQALQEELKLLLSSEPMLKTLGELGTVLFESLEDEQDFIGWCRKVIGNSLAAVAQQAICTLLPDVDESEIIADPVFQDDILTIWLCEKGSGGSGVISQLQDDYAEDPLKVLNIIAQSIQVSDCEQLDCDLYELLSYCNTDNNISSSLKSVRDTENYQQRIDANKKLKKNLIEAGFQFSHSFSAVLYSRILRPGSNLETDCLLKGYLDRWQELEVLLGFELPINIVALAISVAKNTDNSPKTIFSETCKIQSVLWPRGNAVRQAVLAFYNPFQNDNNRTERLLVAPMCSDMTSKISCGDNDWLSRLYKALIKDGKCDLLLSRERSRELTNIIAILHVTPIDTHGLLFFPRVFSIKRNLNQISLCIELAEAIQ